MAMTQQLWTISGLSVELDTDRRTLSKRLSGLRPDDERVEGGKRVKRWRLARVIKHLGTAGTAGRGTRDESIEAKVQAMIADEKHVCTQFLFPAVVSSKYFTGFFLGYLHKEMGLTKPQALRAYQAACLALSYAIGEFFAESGDYSAGTLSPGGADDEGDIKVMVPGCFQDLRDLGPEAYAAKHWPDKAA